MESKLDQASIDDIIGDDLFKLSDVKVIHELVQLITSESISNEKVIQYVKQRENKFWFGEMESFYQSLLFASDLIALIRKQAQTKYLSRVHSQ